MACRPPCYPRPPKPRFSRSSSGPPAPTGKPAGNGGFSHRRPVAAPSRGRTSSSGTAPPRRGRRSPGKKPQCDKATTVTTGLPACCQMSVGPVVLPRREPQARQGSAQERGRADRRAARRSAAPLVCRPAHHQGTGERTVHASTDLERLQHLKDQARTGHVLREVGMSPERPSAAGTSRKTHPIRTTQWPGRPD